MKLECSNLPKQNDEDDNSISSQRSDTEVSSQPYITEDELISDCHESNFNIEQNVNSSIQNIVENVDEVRKFSDECQRSSSVHSELLVHGEHLRHQSFRLTHRASFLSTEQNGFLNDRNDFIDSVPEQMSFTYIEAFALLFSIGSFLIDIVTDVTVATFHYLNQNYWYFALTVSFIAFPTLIMTAMSLRWYILDAREDWPKVSKIQWLMRVFFLLFQLGPIMRYIDSLLYGLQFRKHNDKLDRKAARKYYKYMIYEDADATMLRLFECFLEAAPQLVLQIYILAVNSPHGEDDWTVVVQIVSVGASLVSLSWSLVSYMRILRMSLSNKRNITWPAAIVQFIWRLMVIASRVLTLALFASEFTYYIGVVCGIHWVLMFFWIVSMKTSFCNNLLEELLYNAIVAVIFIFCYFNPVDTPTRKRYTFYYSLSFVEDVILLALWYNACDPNKWYRLPAFIGFFVCFFGGLIVMMIYYLKLHPTQNIRLFRANSVQLDHQSDTSQQQQQPQVSINCISSQLKNTPSVDNVNYTNIDKRKSNSNDSYQRQFSEVWTTQNRLLHPRPAIPTI